MADQEPVNSEQVKKYVTLLAGVQPRLYRYIMGLVGNAADADQVLQEARRRMGQRFGEYTEGTDFLIWAMMIAFGCVEEYRRREAQSGRLVFSDAVVEVLKKEALSAAVWEKIPYGDLKRCILKLPEKDRHLVQARYIDGKSVETITVGSIRSEAGVTGALARIHDVLLDCVKSTKK